jgi:hypothetical protein
MAKFQAVLCPSPAASFGEEGLGPRMMLLLSFIRPDEALGDPFSVPELDMLTSGSKPLPYFRSGYVGLTNVL